jgi:acyl-homoserine-lactone acylase
MPRIQLLFLLLLINVPLFSQSLSKLSQQVTIRRTAYGVPHVKADNLKAVAYGLAWCELEDYGEKVIRPLISARGDLALIDGYDAIDGDFVRQLGYQRTLETYGKLYKPTRDMLEGFAAGVNDYIKKHQDKYPQYKDWIFTGVDVAATVTSVATSYQGSNFKKMLLQQKAVRDSIKLTEAGSNAWALAPSRTKDGHAILVRNPHLSWSAGYYEAQITVADTLNFYGDFRIGGLFAIIGGFNERLGWATTNNHPDLEEVYALRADSTKADHFIIDNVSVPIEKRMLTAEFQNGNALATETREFLFTLFGPVIHRDEGKIYVLKQAGDGEYRRGEQFTKMLLAKNLEEWKAAMRMQAITSSNYTYADADGNIFYIWNATTPVLSHATGGDTAAVEITKSADIWQRYIPFDELPQLLNPKGGYLHNENDPFHFTNLNEVLKPEDYPNNFPQPRLRQRSQHSLSLIHNDDVLTLEEVVNRKHSMNMLLADQLKDDLVSALKATELDAGTQKAVLHIEKWDNSVRADSRGGVLFQEWFTNYANMMGEDELYATPWSFDDPMETPDGIAHAEKAVKAFSKAMSDLNEQYTTWDLAWGDIHRLRLADLDLPASGGPGGLGCFRVLWFTDTEDGKRKIRGGDGWQLAVEFSDPPKAYSILAYGQSNNPESAHHTDQAELFNNNEMKQVLYTEKAIRKGLIKSYRPGE